MTTPEALSHETRQIEELPGLDQLRGPNSTLKLVTLAENYVRRYEGELSKYDRYYGDREKACEAGMSCVVRHLQQWATLIDKKIIQAAANTPPENKSSLERIVGEMVQSGQIPNGIDLFSFKKPVAPTGAILPFNHLRSHQWIAVKALFDIDTSGISTAYYFNIINNTEYDPSRFYTVHEYMLQLIAEAVGRKGYKIENVTIPEQERANQPIKAYSIPSGIESVSIIFATFNDRLATIVPTSNGAGYPNIWNAALKFEPSFLASVGPLTDGEYQKYVPKKEPERERKASGEQREGWKEQPKFNFGQGQTTENLRARRETFDPRDPKGYYKTLGVNPDVDPEDLDEIILGAYRRLSHKYHPDTGGDTTDHRKMVEINLAYEFLSKGDNRKNYGRHN